MFMQKVITLTQRLEDPKHPLLGPNIKGLYMFGLWQTRNKFYTKAYNIMHISTILFICSLAVELYTIKHDFNKILESMSISVLSFVCLLKSTSVIVWQKEWQDLVSGISQEELRQLEKRDPMVSKSMNGYKKYTRIITYLYWFLVCATVLLLNSTPLLKFFSSKSYRDGIRSGIEPLPQILSSWFPFDNKKMPGYAWGLFIHILMSIYGSGILAVYDMNAVAIMSYLKGQMGILKENCRNLFEGDEISEKVVTEKIKECHRHHSVLVKHYKMLNALLSPVMFLYVLVCSLTICCAVVQLNSNEAATSQKLLVFEYTTALVSQLFLYCWHSNEVAVETMEVDRGVYYSDWWKGDKKIRRQILLLAGKLDAPLILNAGPFTKLSVATFIDIMKGSYSFYTLFSQMQDDK